MASFWMIRAGEGGHLAEDFATKSVVAIGWPACGSLQQVKSIPDMRAAVQKAYPESSPGAVVNSAAVLFKFKNANVGDNVVSYDPERREYLLGRITGPYEYNPQMFAEHPNVRRVEWEKRVSRDELSVTSKNTLGSTLTLFEPGADVFAELHGGATDATAVTPVTLEMGQEDQESDVILKDTLGRAHEFIKDKILSLSPEQMESLAAALLRAMGYKTRITEKGPDGGRDVLASPDGLGFQNPRIITEVKHRPKSSIGAETVRGFIGGLRGGDRGLYISTGGFSREARYEADRATVPITLVDSGYLAELVVEYYEQFDSEGRTLVPLKKVYWPLS